MKRLPVTANRSARGINGAMVKASAGMKRATAQTKVLGRAIGSLGPALAGFLAVGGISRLIQDFDRIGKLAIRFGESAETIQRVSHAANLAGANIEQVAKAMQQATRYAQEAIDGNAEYAEAFDRLGINVQKFISMSLEDRLKAFASGFNNAKTEGEGFNALMSVLGSRVAGELIPLFRQGGDAMEEAFNQVNPASQKTIDNIQKLNDRWTTLKAAAAGPLATIVGWMEGLILSIQAVGKALNGLGDAYGEFLSGMAIAFEAMKDRDFVGASETFQQIPGDMKAAMERAGVEAWEGFSKAWDAVSKDGVSSPTGSGAQGGAPASTNSASTGGSATAAEDAFAKAQARIDKAELDAEAQRMFKQPAGNLYGPPKPKASQGGGMLGMFARIAGGAAKNGALGAAAQAAMLQSQGFGGLAGLAQMQAARMSGVGPGEMTALSRDARRLDGLASTIKKGPAVGEGGLGATRALSRERFDARKAAREEAKNRMSGVEKTNSLLGEIRSDLKTSLTVGVS